jgi:hypothetical protein
MIKLDVTFQLTQTCVAAPRTMGLENSMSRHSSEHVTVKNVLDGGKNTIWLSKLELSYTSNVLHLEHRST